MTTRRSQRYQTKSRDDEARLAARMRELARQRPRFAYQSIVATPACKPETR